MEETFKEAFYYSWANEIPVIKNGEIIHKFRDYQGMHTYWDNIAKKYNLEYKTTYGVYDGVDVYENGYYP